MLNIYDYVNANTCFRKFIADDLMLASYKCMMDQSLISLWTHHNAYVYVLSGSDKWIADDQTYFVQQGDVAFIRRGAYLAQRCSEEEFNAVLLFISDAFIHSLLTKYPTLKRMQGASSNSHHKTIYVSKADVMLQEYFMSLKTYLHQPQGPAPEIIRVRFEELLLDTLIRRWNTDLAGHLCTAYVSGKVSIPSVMESSFMFNMSMEEYARLCARSLSTFKADFFAIYKTTPGKWIITRRLQYAKCLVETTDDAVSDIALKSGFKNATHFVRVFKEAYGVPPMKYRLQSQFEAASA